MSRIVRSSSLFIASSTEEHCHIIKDPTDRKYFMLGCLNSLLLILILLFSLISLKLCFSLLALTPFMVLQTCLNLSPSFHPVNISFTDGCWHDWTSWLFLEEGGLPNICHSGTLLAWGQTLFQLHQFPSPRSCPLGFQRSSLIVSVIEGWHSSRMQSQAAKNKSNWLLASVIGWLVAIACLAATTVRHADRATFVQSCSSALNFTTGCRYRLCRVICRYLLWTNTRNSQRFFYFYQKARQRRQEERKRLING